MAVTPIDPSTLASLEHEFDARDITGLSDSDPVSTWEDSEGSADATESGTTRPTYRTNIQNSLPGVFFDGTDLLSTAAESVTDRAARTVIVVGRKTSNSGGDHHTALSLVAGSNNGISCIFRDRATQAIWTASNSWRVTGAETAVVDDNYVWAWHWDAADACGLHQDLVDNNVPGTTAALPSHGRIILGGFNAGGNHFLRGYIFHVLVFSEVLSRSTREGVEAWLADIWAPDRASRYTYTPSGTKASGVRDFDGDTLDAEPPTTTRRWGAAADRFVVKENLDALNDRVLRSTDAGVSQAMSFDEIDGVTDIDVLHRFARASGNNKNNGPVVRGAGGSSTKDGLVAAIDSSNLGVLRTIAWESNTVDEWQYAFTHAADTFYWMRTRAWGDIWRVKIWSGAEGDEPDEWLVTRDAGTITGTGWSGMYSFRRGDTDVHAWATNGAVAALDAPGSELEITTASLPHATIGEAYSATLEATGGSEPYTWAIDSGSLPDGLTLNPATGEISGTPTTRETQTFTVQLTDDEDETDTQELTLAVRGSNYTDFAEHSAGSGLPTGWNEQWLGSDDWEVADDASATGGRLLQRASGSTNVLRFARWSEPGTDLEHVIARARMKTSAPMSLADIRRFNGIVVRGTGSVSGGDATGYALYMARQQGPAGTYFQLYRVDDTTFEFVAGREFSSTVNWWTPDEWINVEVEVVGATVRVWSWTDAEDEREHLRIEYTDPDPLPSGGVGLSSHSGTTAQWFDTFEVEETDAAPDPPVIEASVDGTTVTITTTPFASDRDGAEHTATRYLVEVQGGAELINETTEDFLTSIVYEAADGIPENETIEVTAFHRDGELESEASNTVELTTGTETPLPDKPTVTVEEKGVDFGRISLSAFAHSEGVTTAEDWDPDTNDLPYPIAAQIRITRVSDDEVVADTDLSALTAEEKEAFFEDLDDDESYTAEGRWQDGKYGATSPWSDAVAFSTDAIPPDAPTKPTISIVTCARSGTTLSGSTYDHDTTGSGTAHAKTQWRLCAVLEQESTEEVIACSSRVTDDPAELEDFTLEMPPGLWRFQVRYIDELGRAGPYSDESSTCEILAIPSQVEVLSPVPGSVIDADTLVTWEMDDDSEDWEYRVRLSTDEGETWSTESEGSTTPEYEFQISGRTNGRYILEISACHPEDEECGDAVYVPLHLDRTGMAAVSYNFQEMEELPAGWEEILDTSGKVSTTLVRRPLTEYTLGRCAGCDLCREATPEEEEEFESENVRIPYGALMQTESGLAIRNGFLAFTELGEPDVGEMTLSFCLAANDTAYWGWRFSQLHFMEAGLGWKGRSRYTVKAGGQAWPFPTDDPPRVCEDDLTKLGCPCGAINCTVCTEAYVDALPWAMRAMPTRVHQYGVSWGGAAIKRRITGQFGVSRTSIPMKFRPVVGAGPEGKSYGLKVGLPRRVDACCPKWTIYTMRQRVTRTPDSDLRIRIQILGPGVDPEAGWIVDDTYDKDSDFATSCGPCGLAYYHIRYLVGDPGFLIRSVSVSGLEYQTGCDEPTDPLHGCEADWDATVFEDDDVTPWYGEADAEGQVTEADFYDSRSCPRPYLIVPDDFSETEIDFPAGASTIGAIKVGVVDFPHDDVSDQDGGIVTARLAEAVGRRFVVRRFREDLGMVTVFDGVVENYEITEGEPATVWFHIRDPRERERDTRLFSDNGTFVIFGENGDSGPISDYGERPDGSHLIEGVGPFLSIHENIEHFRRYEDDPPADGIFYGFTNTGIIPLLERLMWPQLDSEGVYRYRDFSIRWRAKGSGDDWTVLTDMPRSRHAPAVAQFTVPGVGSFPVASLYFGSFDEDDIPDENQEIEFQVLAVHTTEDTPFIWDNGTFGDLLLEIYDGEHTQSPPRIRFNRDRLEEWAEETPRARFFATEPVEDMREWVQENIYAPLMHAPSFDADMRIQPAPWQLPNADETLVEIDPDWIIPMGDWSDATDSIVNRVTYRYIREYVRPNEDGESLPPWQRLEERTIQRTNIYDPSTFAGSGEITYEPQTVRAIGTPEGAPVTGDTTDELGAQLAEQAAAMVLDRFGWGAPEWVGGVVAGMGHGPTFDPHTLDLKVGQWLKVALDWEPDYPLPRGPGATRGAARLMQIVSITDPDIAHRRLRLIDGGPDLPALDAPTIGTVTINDDLRVVVPITAFPGGAPDGYRARVDYALSDTEPDHDSGIWRMMGRIDETGDVTSPPLPSGATVWIRARGEAAQRRPSSWTTPADSEVDPRAGLTGLAVALADATPLLSWSANEFTEGLSIRYVVHEIGTEPGSFTAWGDLDADAGSATLHGISVSVGEAVIVEATAYPEWTASGGVSGDAGWTSFASAHRADADAPSLEWATAERTDDGLCGESVNEPVVHTVTWSVDGSMSGYEIRIWREVDDVGEVLQEDASGPYEDEIADVEHDTDLGTRTEYVYRVDLMRSSDSVRVQSQTAPPVITYESDCAES